MFAAPNISDSLFEFLRQKFVDKLLRAIKRAPKRLCDQALTNTILAETLREFESSLDAISFVRSGQAYLVSDALDRVHRFVNVIDIDTKLPLTMLSGENQQRNTGFLELDGKLISCPSNTITLGELAEYWGKSGPGVISRLFRGLIAKLWCKRAPKRQPTIQRSAAARPIYNECKKLTDAFATQISDEEIAEELHEFVCGDRTN
jgi:hypothetical protein